MNLGEKLRNAMEKLRNSSVIDKESVKESVKEIQRALISSDVEVKLVLELSKKIEEEAFKDLPKGITRREHVVKVTYALLAEMLGSEVEAPQNPERILLVGLQGNGKTTTTAKLAKYYAKRGKRVGVVCADSFRPAAYEQIKQLSEKIDIPFYGEPNEKNAAKIVENGLEKLKDKDIVIVDSAGRSGLDEELSKEIKAVNKVFQPDETWLVLGGDVGQVAKKQAIAFHDSVGVNGIILTRMDGSAKGGGALTACNATQAPVYFLGIGEKLDDLMEFNAERYLSKAMGYGDLQGLLEKIKEAEIAETSLEALTEGKFNLKIFYDQLKAARSMGPLDKVMDMMGMKAQIPKDQLDISEKKLDSFKVIMDSMTVQEKENPDLINSSRIDRVVSGSGKKVEEVRELLKHYKNMQKMFKSFKKIGEGDLNEGKMNKMLGKIIGKTHKKKKFKIR